MDFSFILQLAIVIGYYHLTRYLNSNIEWYSKQETIFKPSYLKEKYEHFKLNQRPLLFKTVKIFAFIIWAVPAIISFSLFSLFVLFKGTITLLENSNYFLQLTLCFGFISLFFFIINIINSKEEEIRNLKELAKKQSKEISDLSNKITTI